MKIEINQKKFAFIQDKYEILVDEKLTYKAKSDLFTFGSRIGIFNLNEKEIGTVEKEFEFPAEPYPKYTLSFGTYSSSRMLTISNNHYRLFATQGAIDIYGQKGRKLGIFLNDVQVGLIDKSKKAIFGGDNYTIKIESSAIEKELIIAFVLAFDDFFHSKGTMLSYDFGNIFIDPVKEIDPAWEPKN